MDEHKFLSKLCSWIPTVIHGTRKNQISFESASSNTTSVTSSEADWKILQRKNSFANINDLHSDIHQQFRLNWCEWLLTDNNIQNSKKKPRKLQQEFKKAKLSSNINSIVDIVEKTFLNFMPDSNLWNEIRKCLLRARQDNDPLPIIDAYCLHQEFSTYLNKYLSINTYHELKLYCTFLNCPILARTQEFTEAMTSLFFHPKLDEFIVRHKTVYRNTFIDDKKLVSSLKVGAIIMTTTFLLTSVTHKEVESSIEIIPQNMISIFCIYNIHDTHGRTALDLKKIAGFHDTQEILILCYVKFIIKSFEQTDDGRKIAIYFDQCEDIDI